MPVNFTDAYVLSSGVVGGSASTVIGSGTYTVDDGDNLLEAGGADTFDITVTSGSGSATFQAIYVGTNDDGDVFADVNGTQILLTNSFYDTLDDPDGPNNVDLAICFARGTHIATPEGARAIETLGVGDRVITADGGVETLRWIGSRRHGAGAATLNARLRPVTILQGALGNDRDLTVSPEHRMLVTGWRAEVMFGAPEMLVPAKALVNGETILRGRADQGVEYWHFMLDHHALVRAEGCVSESLNPSVTAQGALTDAARAEILAIFPELEKAPGGLPLARPVMALRDQGLIR